MDPTYSVQIGCVVGETYRNGPDYTAVAVILKMEEEESEEESEEVVALVVQVHAPPVQGV